MAEEEIIGDAQPIPPTNSISIYKEDSTEDFPVLKAFQQYLDAEQSKARKRMVGLCVFFVILMVIVIGVFLVMLHNVQERNQALNDRLLTLVVNDRQKAAAIPAPVVVPAPQPAANAAELRAITDTLKVLKTEIADRRTDEIKQAAEAARQAAAAAKAAAEQVKAVKESPSQQQQMPAVNGTTAFNSPAQSRNLQTEQERIDRERARLIEERAKLQVERERFRQEEIERQRRKLYPEYYSRLDENKKAAEQSRPVDVRPPVNTDRKRTTSQVAKKPVVDDGPTMKRDPKTGAITYFEPEDEELNNLVKDLPKTKSRVPVETENHAKNQDTKSGVKQVENLITETQRKPSDPTNTPPSRVKVEIKGKAADWLIPIQ